MYFLIESVNNTKTVVATYDTYEEAEDIAIEMHNDQCDYFITKLVSNF
jgi:hypothetical protein